MSGYMGKLFTAVSAALEFNTATLSGAIDIVVIEDDMGRRQCSPFHVRFGKLQLLKSRGIPVDIELNDQRTDLRMLLGAAGEAYFYNRDLASKSKDRIKVDEAGDSPQVSTNEKIETEAQSLSISIPGNEQADSDSAQALIALPSSPGKSDDVKNGSLGGKLARTESDRLTQSKPWESLSAIPSKVVETTTSDYPFGYISDSEVELTRNERAGTTEVVDEPRSPPLFPSQRKWTSTVAQNPPLAHGFEPTESSAKRVIAEAHTADMDDVLSEDQESALFGLPSVPHDTVSTEDKENDSEKGTHESSPTPPQDEYLEELMANDDGSQCTVESKRTNAVTLDANNQVTVSVSINDIVGDEEGKLDCRSVDGYDADDDDVEDLQEQVAYVLSRPKSLSAKRRRTLGAGRGENDSGRLTSSQDEEDADNTFPLEGLISLSLCGSLLTDDMEEAQIMELFQRHQVAYEEFAANPSLLHDPSLLFRIGNRLVELRVAVPFVFSALAFNQRMDIDSLARLTAPESKTKLEPPKSPPTPSRRFTWFGWASPTPTVVGEPLLQQEDLDVLDTAQESEKVEKSEKQNARTEGTANGTQVSEVAAVKDGDGDVQNIAGSVKQEGNDSVAPQNHPFKLSTLAMANSGENGLTTYEGNQPAGPTTVQQETQTESISFSELDPDALSLTPTPAELEKLDLKPGANSIRFVVESSEVELNCRIFLWSSHTKIVISDVDGTITRSDVLGHLLPAVGRDWSQVGVAGLYSQIERNGYKMLYLTARPIGQASQTRTFLHDVTQGSAKLPNGPVLMSPNRLVESFTREVIRRKPQEFKIAALREIRSLFSPDYNPFHAGFGNRDTDVISYRAVGLIPQRIFVVNPRGELVVMKAKYESAASYSTLQDLVESVFPDISGHAGLEKIQALTESATYNDWNYWKESLPELDLDELLAPT